MTQKNILILLGVILLLVAVSTASAKDELKIATWDDVNTFDPGWMTSTERELSIMTCLYNGLVKYKEGSWEVVPDLATSWKISSDSKEITFYLRKGVKFHKGFGEMTSEDVKFSFERITDPALKSPEKDNWGRLDHVEVLDKYTVKLVLKSPMANLFTSALPVNTGMIVSQKAVEKFGQKEFGFNPIGTGPYQLEKWEPKKSVKLVSNEDYWDEKPKIKRVTFIPIVEDSTCEAALKSGEIDIGRAASINIDAFKRDSRFKVYTKPGLKYWWIGFTVNKPPFDNPKLREACRYAIDVNRILKGAFFGIADRANTILPPGMPGYWVDAPEYKVDIEKAKQLLKEGESLMASRSDVSAGLTNRSKLSRRWLRPIWPKSAWMSILSLRRLVPLTMPQRPASPRCTSVSSQPLLIQGMRWVGLQVTIAGISATGTIPITTNSSNKGKRRWILRNGPLSIWRLKGKLTDRAGRYGSPMV